MKKALLAATVVASALAASLVAAPLASVPAQQAAVYKPLLDVRPEYLNAGYDEVQATYGSFDRYLKDGLGIDARELKELKKDLLVG
ncbi:MULTISPECIES: tyrosine-protein phosphatase [Streptomyces]|uniref:Tyrosine-protein phosphatase n=1 Tax=Streptomyces virginiae TaxID=1961 RepID=A0ABZ1TDY8_STRVG|nr:tyrosine-protein phosphatase [Streptomyces virginiae]MCX4959962.1 tyrosine-protein phosphatase [Streptomyces virginiae]WTB24194.1 tyrosine-protein phosphatase [Streptomyces virginiae]